MSPQAIRKDPRAHWLTTGTKRSTMLPQKRPLPPHAASVCCVGCADSLSKQTFFEVTSPQSPEQSSSCSHYICLSCFSSAQSERSADLHLSCPSCCRPAHAWDIHKFGRSHHSDNVISHRMQLPTNKDVHPIVWFANQP